ncbi:MAG: SUF system NifU family Fe-S cluster assembly protein [Gammaproteobacteria bacterium]|nr:SUF system NifU family Fe-S cluster assembly protein [Gammaproteobacteria bacterium]
MTEPRLSTDELRQLYRELILDHARQPRHFGALGNATHSAEGFNPLCGDKLRLYLRVSGDSEIADASFEGSGCAISVASASLLTDTVIGMSSEQALELTDALVCRLTGGRSAQSNAREPELGRLRALEGVREFPARVKCATLAWHALRSAVANDKSIASTE